MGQVAKPFMGFDDKVGPHDCGDPCSFFAVGVDVKKLFQLLIVPKVVFLGSNFVYFV